ncbi:NADH:ubiquinone oxidoreductase 11.6kD subunit, partial [Eremomyces bilateralis CBS 781.70]
RRTFTTTLPRPSGGEPHYEPPSGWLWGIQPGQKYESEGWENVFIYGFMGSFGLLAVAYAFKPDTSIQTWAIEEARRRLEKEGILPDPDAE